MQSSPEKHSGWLLIIGIIVGVLALTAGPAFAALTFSGTGITGDGAVVIDSPSTISIGTSTATGINIGSGSSTVYIGPPESMLNPFIQGWAAPENVLITEIGSSSNNYGLTIEGQATANDEVALEVVGMGPSGVGGGFGGYATTNGGFGSALELNGGAIGPINADKVFGISVASPDFESGATAVTAEGIDIADVTGATNNYAIKTGLGKVEFGDVLQVDPTTFSSLPTCNSGEEGTQRPVTNSATSTLGATITGGGSSHVLAYCDGTNWTVMAK